MKTALFFSYNGLYKLFLLELMDTVETSFSVKIELAVTPAQFARKSRLYV